MTKFYPGRSIVKEKVIGNLTLNPTFQPVLVENWLKGWASFISKICLRSRKYDGKKIAVKVLPECYVRDNDPGKVPLLPGNKGSKKWQEAIRSAELSVPELWQTVSIFLSKDGLSARDERVSLKAVSAQFGY